MRRIPQPTDPRDDAARKVLQEQSKKMDPRQFRDALTRASGSTFGVHTNVKQWNRWDR